MSIIETRIAKLEQITRVRTGNLHIPGIADAELDEIQRAAATCSSADELASYLRSRLPADDGIVVSLDDRRRIDAVLNATARAFFDEATA